MANYRSTDSGQQNYTPYPQNMDNQYSQPPVEYWQSYPACRKSVSQPQFLPNADPYQNWCGNAVGYACPQYDNTNNPTQLSRPAMADNYIQHEWQPDRNQLHTIQERFPTPQPLGYRQDWENNCDNSSWGYNENVMQQHSAPLIDYQNSRTEFQPTQILNASQPLELANSFRPTEMQNPNRTETGQQVEKPLSRVTPTSFSTVDIPTSANQYESPRSNRSSEVTNSARQPSCRTPTLSRHCSSTSLLNTANGIEMPKSFKPSQESVLSPRQNKMPQKTEILTSVKVEDRPTSAPELKTQVFKTPSKQTEISNSARLPKLSKQSEKPVLQKQCSTGHLEKTPPCSPRNAKKPNSPKNLEKPGSPKCLDRLRSSVNLEKLGSPRRPERKTSEGSSLFLGPTEGPELHLQTQQLQERLQRIQEQQKFQEKQLYSIPVGDSSGDTNITGEDIAAFPPSLRKLLKDPRYRELLAEGLDTKDSIPPFPLPLPTLEAYPVLIPFDEPLKFPQFPDFEMPSPHNCNPPAHHSYSHPSYSPAAHPIQATHPSQSSHLPQSTCPSYPVYPQQQESQHCQENKNDTYQQQPCQEQPRYANSKKGLAAGGQGGQQCPNISEGGDPTNELYRSHNKKRMADKSPEGCLDVVDTELREAFLHIPLCPLVPDFDKTENACPCPQHEPPSCGGGRCSARGGAGADQQFSMGHPQPPYCPPVKSQTQQQYCPPVSKHEPFCTHQNQALPSVATGTSAPQYDLCSYPPMPCAPIAGQITLAESPSQKTSAIPQAYEQRYSNVEDAELYEHIKNLKQVYERAMCILNNANSGSFPATEGCQSGGPPEGCQSGGPPEGCAPTSDNVGATFTEGCCAASKLCGTSSTPTVECPKMICPPETERQVTPATREKSLHSYVHKLVDAVTDDLNSQIRTTVLQGVMDFIHKNHAEISGEGECKPDK